MPRGNRYHLAGHVWHLTERCHRRQLLLKFARDRRAWMKWLYGARRRLGLSVLNYQVTSDDVHLLVLDRGGDEVARSTQLDRRVRWPRAATVGRGVRVQFVGVLLRRESGLDDRRSISRVARQRVST